MAIPEPEYPGAPPDAAEDVGNQPVPIEDDTPVFDGDDDTPDADLDGGPEAPPEMESVG